MRRPREVARVDGDTRRAAIGAAQPASDGHPAEQKQLEALTTDR